MKYNVTQLDEKNIPVESVLGNYFLELEPGNYQAEEASDISDTQPEKNEGDQAGCQMCRWPLPLDNSLVPV